jgi:hypothetical protein
LSDNVQPGGKIRIVPARTREKEKMAKPIELGLVLEGEDAREFHRYMENPSHYDTPEGRELARRAAHLARKTRL